MSAVLERVGPPTAFQEARPARREGLFPTKALGHVLVLAGAVSVAAAYFVLVPLDGARYYTTAVRSRGTLQATHQALRPSGPIGNALGVLGTILMLSTLLYVVRKRSKRLSKVGSQKVWLEAHIFCGLVGPVFITLHSSFKFGGVISVAYWSMLLVVLSGFVGRYLYVRIPKTIRGNELSLVEVEARASELKTRLADSTIPLGLFTKLEAIERELLPVRTEMPALRAALFGDVKASWRLYRLRKKVTSFPGIDTTRLAEAIDLVSERVTLLRRAATLTKTKRLFELWHVFHRPLVWVLFSVATLHVAVAFYMGYTLLGR